MKTRVRDLHKPVLARPRLTASVVVGLVVLLLLPGGLHGATRGILAWDAGVVCFLALFVRLMVSATPQQLRYRAQLEDERRWVILLLMVAAASISLAAIGSLLHHAKSLEGTAQWLHVALGGATIILSWFFTHVMFALHYAHTYYGDGPGRDAGPTKGLDFPHEGHPDYWDFFYFSLIIGMTCQVSDVQVTSHQMRRLALAQGALAFFFNTIVLALTINIAAGFL